MTINKTRVKRLSEILPRYPEDPYTNLIDLFADAMHWCNLSDVNFGDVLRIARMHFEAEMDKLS